MENFNEISTEELIDIDGGALPIVVLMVIGLSGGFGAGYGLSRWLG